MAASPELVCDFTGTYADEGFLDALRAEGAAFARVDLRGVEGTHCYCDDAARAEILRRLPVPLPPIRWLDSGDYHYMSCLLALRQERPFHLALLDHHRDDMPPALGPGLSCGGWVDTLRRECPLLRDILMVGPEGCVGQVPAEWLAAHEGQRVYVSLDEDILSPEHVRTGWSQGTHSLLDVEEALRTLFARMEVVAVDVCGGLSVAQGATAEDLRVNCAANLSVRRVLGTQEEKFAESRFCPYNRAK